MKSLTHIFIDGKIHSYVENYSVDHHLDLSYKFYALYDKHKTFVEGIPGFP
jgi:hypothetical protein